MTSFRQWLRPRKWRNALSRRAFERVIGATPLDPGPHRFEDVGTPYGGWMVPVDLVGANWTCYSVGAGGDVSFDAALLERWGATVRAIEPVEDFVERARAALGSHPAFTAHRVAVSTADGPITMLRTPDPVSLSLSGAGLYDSTEAVEVPGRSLPSLMRELGDERVDFLKLDVEGLEYDVVGQLDLRAMGIRVFAVQLHHNAGIGAARRLIAHVERQGYRAAAMRPAVKLTFVARDA